jgi:hypothetical protein
MVIGLILAALFVVSAVAGIMGWVADSRDPEFSLWPLDGHGPATSGGVRGMRPSGARRSS